MDSKLLIKSLAGLLTRVCGLSWLMREVILPKRSVILCYHAPEPGVLREHLAYLSQRYNIIPLERLVEALVTRRWSMLPRKSLVITFDDGHKTNYELQSLLQEYAAPATIFVCSHIVNTRRKYWFGCGYPDNNGLKTIPNQERLFILKVKAGFEQEKEYPQAQALTLAQMQEMQRDIDFQSHTRFHPVLTQCADGEALEEIKDSKACLERMLGSDIRHFAYPNGNYSEREIRFLKQCGYTAAVTMDPGSNGPESDLYRLKRMGLSDQASVNELAGELSGFFNAFRSLMR